MSFRGGKSKVIVLSKEHVDAQRGVDLKNFQDEVAMWRQKVEDAKEELASIQAKIEQSQNDHKQWLIDKTAEISGDIAKLEEARVISIDEHDKKREEIQSIVDRDEEILSRTLSAERRGREEKEKSAQYLSDVQAERSNIEAKQYKLESDIKHNQEILNETNFRIKKNKEALQLGEEKRHELIQIQGRIDGGLERQVAVESSNEDLAKKIAEQLKTLKEKLAQADKLSRDQREFAVKQNEYDLWLKDKAAKEAAQIAKDNELNALERALRKQESDIKRRLDIVKSLEQKQGGDHNG